MLLSNPKLTITFISHHKSSSPSLTSSFRKSPWCRTGHRLYPTEFVGPRHYIQWGSPQSSRKHWDGQEPLGKRLGGGLAVSFFQRGWVKQLGVGVSCPGFQERWVFVGTVQFLVKISQRSCRIINIQRLYQSHFLQKDVHKTHMWKKPWPKLSDISRYEGYGYGEIDLLYGTNMMFNHTNSYSRIFNHSTWPLYKTSQGRLVVMTYLLPVSGKKKPNRSTVAFLPSFASTQRAKASDVASVQRLGSPYPAKNVHPNTSDRQIGKHSQFQVLRSQKQKKSTVTKVCIFSLIWLTSTLWSSLLFNKCWSCRSFN